MRSAIPATLLLTLAASGPALGAPAADAPPARARPAPTATPPPAAPATRPAADRPVAPPRKVRLAPPRAVPRATTPLPPRVVKPDPPIVPAKKKKTFRWTLKFDMEGFYAAQGTFIKDLANLNQSLLPGSANMYRERLTTTAYFTHHLRFEPRISLGKLVTLHMRLDGLQNVVWGDNNGRAQSSLFAGSPTNTNDYGEAISSIQLTYAYLDLDVKLGRLRVGRMASHWGMGALSNSGGDLIKHRGGVDDDFGDNRHPSIYDRILFATKPISVIKTLAKAKDTSSNFILAYAYDRLVEEPYWKDLTLEAQRPYGEQTFLSRQQNNVDEHVLVLAYSNPDFLKSVKALKKWKHKQLVVGAYVVYRTMGSYDGILRYDGGRQIFDCDGPDPPPGCGAKSKVAIIDPYVKLRLGPFLVESEGYVIVGKTEPGLGIPIGDNVDKAMIYAWVVRLGYTLLKKFDIRIDVGQASGDDVLGDGTFRQRPMHPDHSPGLIMYREFIRERSATALAQRLNSSVGGTVSPARGLQTNGGVVNSYYLYPRVFWKVNRMLTLKLAVLTAWSHKQGDDSYLFQTTSCEGKTACMKNHIGTEVDVGVDLRWGGKPGLEHLMFRLDMGYLVFGQQVKDDYDAPGIFALRARLMMVF